MKIVPDFERQAWTVEVYDQRDIELLAVVSEAVETSVLADRTPDGLVSTASYVIKCLSDRRLHPEKSEPVEFCGAEVTHGFFALLGAAEVLGADELSDEGVQRVAEMKSDFISTIDALLLQSPEEQGFLLVQKARLLGNMALSEVYEAAQPERQLLMAS